MEAGRLVTSADAESPANAMAPRPRMEGADLRTVSLYPFLPQAARYMREQGLSLEEVLEHRAFETSRTIAKDKVFSSLERGEMPDPSPSTDGERLASLYAYPLARIIVSCVGDPFLIRRFAVAEAALAHRRLAREEPSFLLRLCESLGLDCYADGPFRIHFADFLAATKRLRGKEWKLINQPLDGGYVLLSREKFLRVLQGYLQNRFEDELPMEVNESLLGAFAGEVSELRERLSQRKANLEAADLGRIRVTNFPPCMQKLLGAVLASENVSHPGRFAIVSFLNNIGLGFEEIYQIFSSVPDFRESVTRYQIEHITGKISGTEYTSPECSTMKSYGICPGPDGLCEKITHPLSYYRIKSKGSARKARGVGRTES